MRHQTRSLLEELNNIGIKKDAEAIVESRATHVIDSAINLIQLMHEHFDPTSAYELEKRFINAIRSADPTKFIRGIRKVRDAKETRGSLRIIKGDAPAE